MMISAKIVLDSVGTNPTHRITTMELVMPRIILSEFNTHRVFSRNSASSRAIPFNTMADSAIYNCFMPYAWQKDHKGMQGSEYITDAGDRNLCVLKWVAARDFAVEQAILLNNLGVTKQICNRLLEPFMWHKVLVTSTEWENFFKLRCPQYVLPSGGEDENGNDWVYRSKKDVIAAHSHPDNLKLLENFTLIDWLKVNKGQAEIHIMALAEAMWDALNESVPQHLSAGEWHIPYASDDDSFANATALKISAARCARVSYTVVGTADKQHEVEADIKLANILLSNGHASPMEHQAKYEPQIESRNFTNFKQYRQQLGL